VLIHLGWCTQVLAVQVEQGMKNGQKIKFSSEGNHTPGQVWCGVHMLLCVGLTSFVVWGRQILPTRSTSRVLKCCLTHHRPTSLPRQAPCDVVFVVQQREHPVFTRKGPHLIVKQVPKFHM
jgi:DnaJ-class molecular chaperone